MSKISIGIVTTPKFKDRYIACKNSWAKDFEHLYYFVGDGINESDLISVPNSNETYESFFPKQQFALKYMFETNPNDDWFCVVGCDHLLIKKNIYIFLDKQNSQIDNIFCQTYERFETMDGLKFELFAGGAGFFISNSLMKKIYPLLESLNEEWDLLYSSGKLIDNCYACGDVALSFFIKKYFNLKLTHVEGMYSQHPKFYQNIVESPLTFHYIHSYEMLNMYNLYK